MHPRNLTAALRDPRAARSPRERILTAARDLIFRHGIRAVSLDEIAEAADSNKMTLYRHFSSKDELVAECLRAFGEEVDLAWEENARAYPGDPKGQLVSWLKHVLAFKTSKTDQGCPVVNVAVELRETDHPARRVIEEFKTKQCARLVELCRQTGLSEPERVADELFLLLEGARVSLQSVGPTGPGARFGEMVEDLIAAHSRRRH
jgi:AcrR family transcriptional regulator